MRHKHHRTAAGHFPARHLVGRAGLGDAVGFPRWGIADSSVDLLPLAFSSPTANTQARNAGESAALWRGRRSHIPRLRMNREASGSSMKKSDANAALTRRKQGADMGQLFERRGGIVLADVDGRGIAVNPPPWGALGAAAVEDGEGAGVGCAHAAEPYFSLPRRFSTACAPTSFEIATDRGVSLWSIICGVFRKCRTWRSLL